MNYTYHVTEHDSVVPPDPESPGADWRLHSFVRISHEKWLMIWEQASLL